ncbi:MAG: TIGR00159 family protein [Spartobacteria bacterium]|nr:TIGR00159 family protein [Spartobacteria bacterium]
MMTYFNQIEFPGISGAIEILILATFFYYIILFFRGTRGAQVLTGFILCMILMIIVTRVFNLDALNWMLQRVSVYIAIAVIIIFQPEIRRALAELGSQPVFSNTKVERDVLDKIIQATMMLAEKKIGALIAIEQEIGTRTIQESGTKMDSKLSPELLATIFFPHTPLHDGGVIINKEGIVAAGCVFPLTHQSSLSKSLGTRHRAAIGLTEETDAICVIVSEETGTISVAYRGRISRGMDEEKLRRLLHRVVNRNSSTSRVKRAQKQLVISKENMKSDEDESWV